MKSPTWEIIATKFYAKHMTRKDAKELLKYADEEVKQWQEFKRQVWKKVRK